MARRIDNLCMISTGTGQFAGAGTSYIVEANNGAIYWFQHDNQQDLIYRKSFNGGITWGPRVSVFSGTIVGFALWYDRWSGISADLIHCAYYESGGSDILYRSLDTSSDTLGTQTTVFAGTSQAVGGAISITRARGGNLVVAGSIDAGAEDGAWESGDVGATWAGTIADPSEAATQDQYLLLPGWNADTQDVMLIFWDASADELSVKRYDDSGNAWTETLIATGMVDNPAANGFPHMAATVDLTNSRNIVIAWSATDTANADLRCWIIDDTSITEVTNVVQNSTDDQALAALTIDTETGYWYAFYTGTSSGSETWSSNNNIYYKGTTDSGTTWSAETLASNNEFTKQIRWIASIPRATSKRARTVGYDVNFGSQQDHVLSVEMPYPKSTYLIGF